MTVEVCSQVTSRHLLGSVKWGKSCFLTWKREGLSGAIEEALPDLSFGNHVLNVESIT